MQKRGLSLILILSSLFLIGILSLSLVSAGFLGDTWNKLTGGDGNSMTGEAVGGGITGDMIFGEILTPFNIDRNSLSISQVQSDGNVKPANRDYFIKFSGIYSATQLLGSGDYAYVELSYLDLTPNFFEDYSSYQLLGSYALKQNDILSYYTNSKGCGVELKFSDETFARDIQDLNNNWVFVDQDGYKIQQENTNIVEGQWYQRQFDLSAFKDKKIAKIYLVQEAEKNAGDTFSCGFDNIKITNRPLLVRIPEDRVFLQGINQDPIYLTEEYVPRGSSQVIRPRDGSYYFTFSGVYSDNVINSDDYAYYSFQNPVEDDAYAGYILKSDQLLTYWTFTPKDTNSNTYSGCGLDLEFIDSSGTKSYMSDIHIVSGYPTDQDGINTTLESVNSYGKWYKRSVDLSQFNGRKINRVLLVQDSNRNKDVQFKCYFDDIKISGRKPFSYTPESVQNIQVDNVNDISHSSTGIGGITPKFGNYLISFRGTYIAPPDPTKTDDYAKIVWSGGEENSLKDYTVETNDFFKFSTDVPDISQVSGATYPGCGMDIKFTDGTLLSNLTQSGIDQDGKNVTGENPKIRNTGVNWYERKFDLKEAVSKKIEKIILVQDVNRPAGQEFACYFDGFKIEKGTSTITSEPCTSASDCPVKPCKVVSRCSGTPKTCSYTNAQDGSACTGGTCSAGACILTSVCNSNGACNAGETSVNCPTDCPYKITLDTSPTAEKLNNDLPSLTKTELPNILKDDFFSGGVGNTDIVQKILLSSTPSIANYGSSGYGLAFGSSGGGSVNLGNYLYKSEIEFTPAINMVQSKGRTINLFGKSYIVETATIQTKLVLKSGTDVLTFQHDNKVLKNGIAINGTLVEIVPNTAGSTTPINNLKTLRVMIYASNAIGTKNQILIGAPFTDPVFGTLKTSVNQVGTTTQYAVNFKDVSSAITPPAAVCGNNILESDEQCDRTSVDAHGTCSASCVLTCDSANGYAKSLINNKVCVVTTSNPECGNGVIETGETCDDSNVVAGDGCSATCILEFSSEIPSCTLANGQKIRAGGRYSEGTGANRIIKYCDANTLTGGNTVKAKDADCIEDYECSSNVCLDGKCTSVRELVQAQQSMLTKIWCAISNPIAFTGRPATCPTNSANDYCKCLVA